MIPGMRNTIKNHDDFIMTDENPKALSPFFVVRAKPAKFPNDPRVGFTATKKTFRHAVDRNLAKRKMRDWVRAQESRLLPNMDYVFIARHAIGDASRDDGRAAMARALHYIARTAGGDAE